MKKNEIVNMFVDPDEQGKGIGSYLLRFLLNLIKTQGYSEVVLNSTITAKPFYSTHNFKIVNQNSEGILGYQIISYRMKLSF